MNLEELRKGNCLTAAHESNNPIVTIKSFKEFGIISENNLFVPFECLLPIPVELLKNNLKYPKWIKFVHELQNWHYWNNNKQDLKIKFAF